MSCSPPPRKKSKHAPAWSPSSRGRRLHFALPFSCFVSPTLAHTNPDPVVYAGGTRGRCHQYRSSLCAQRALVPATRSGATMRRCLPVFVIAVAALASATPVTSHTSGRIVRTVATNQAQLSVEGGGGGGLCDKVAYMPAYVIPKGSPVDPCITCRPRRTTPCYMRTLTIKCTTPAMKNCGLQNRIHKPIIRRRRRLGIVG